MNQPQPVIDLKNATQLKCPCGSEHFVMAYNLHKVSALASPTGQEVIVPQVAFMCSRCLEVLK